MKSKSNRDKDKIQIILEYENITSAEDSLLAVYTILFEEYEDTLDGMDILDDCEDCSRQDL